MKIVLMAAVSPDRVIGRDGAIPWHYPADMRYVKQTTTGHPCVMGRKTWESLPRRPLPGRPNLVLTGQADYEVPAGVIVCASLKEARRRCEGMGAGRMFVLGGEGVFREAMAAADEMLITHVPDRVAGDVHFPVWDEREWLLEGSREEEGLRFARYVRRRGGNRTEKKETESDV